MHHIHDERALLPHKSQLLVSFAIFATFQENTFSRMSFSFFFFFLVTLPEILVIQTETCLRGLVDRSTRSLTAVRLKLAWRKCGIV